MDFEQLYTKYFRKVYGFALSLSRNAHMAEEITQETFYRVLRNPDAFEGRSSVDTYLCSIAHHQYVSMLRRQKPYKEVFTLRTLGELPFAQIGALFQKGDGWARVIYYRAKQKIQEMLQEEAT